MLVWNLSHLPSSKQLARRRKSVTQLLQFPILQEATKNQFRLVFVTLQAYVYGSTVV